MNKCTDSFLPLYPIKYQLLHNPITGQARSFSVSTNKTFGIRLLEIYWRRHQQKASVILGKHPPAVQRTVMDLAQQTAVTALQLRAEVLKKQSESAVFWCVSQVISSAHAHSRTKHQHTHAASHTLPLFPFYFESVRWSSETLFFSQIQWTPHFLSQTFLLSRTSDELLNWCERRLAGSALNMPD